MKTLSIRQPWAWAILHAGKPVENRSWSGSAYRALRKFRGPILLHASKSVGTREDFDDATESMLAIGVSERAVYSRECAGLDRAGQKWVPSPNLLRGGIVGRARVADVVLEGGYSDQAVGMRHQLAESPWYAGGFALVLADVEPLPFVPWPGALGLFEVPDDYAERAKVQVAP